MRSPSPAWRRARPRCSWSTSARRSAIGFARISESKSLRISIRRLRSRVRGRRCSALRLLGLFLGGLLCNLLGGLLGGLFGGLFAGFLDSLLAGLFRGFLALLGLLCGLCRRN